MQARARARCRASRAACRSAPGPSGSSPQGGARAPSCFPARRGRHAAPRGPHRSIRRTRTARTRPTAPSRATGTTAGSARDGSCRPDSSMVAVGWWCAPSADHHLDVAHRAAHLERAGAAADGLVVDAFHHDLAQSRVRGDAHVGPPVELEIDLAHLAADGAGPAVEPAARLEVARRNGQVDRAGESLYDAVPRLHVAGDRALDSLDAKVAGLDA